MPMLRCSPVRRKGTHQTHSLPNAATPILSSELANLYEPPLLGPPSTDPFTIEFRYSPGSPEVHVITLPPYCQKGTRSNKDPTMPVQSGLQNSRYILAPICILSPARTLNTLEKRILQYAMPRPSRSGSAALADLQRPPIPCMAVPSSCLSDSAKKRLTNTI